MSAMYDQEQYRTLAKATPRVENQTEEIATPGVEICDPECIQRGDRAGMDSAMRERDKAVGL